MNQIPLYQVLARALHARQTCEKTGNTEWFTRHGERIEKLCREHLPSGSGFDSGVILDIDASQVDRLVFNVSFHHMNDVGMYDGWTDHSIVVKPSLAFGVDLRITGRDRNGIKDYMVDVFDPVFRMEVNEFEGAQP